MWLYLLSFVFSSAFSAHDIVTNGFSIQVQHRDLESQIQSTKKGQVVSTFSLERGFIGPEVLKLEAFQSQGENFVFLDFFRGYDGSQSMRACRDAYLFKLSRTGKLEKKYHLNYQCAYQDESKEADGETFQKPFRLDKSSATLRKE